MSVAVKMHHTEKVAIKIGTQPAEIFYLPTAAADNLLLFVKNCQPEKAKDNDWIEFSDACPEVKDPAQRIAATLRGARYKAGLSQIKLAEKLKITQGDLSKMEHAKRPIGKKLALKLAKLLDVDYRIFL